MILIIADLFHPDNNELQIQFLSKRLTDEFSNEPFFR